MADVDGNHLLALNIRTPDKILAMLNKEKFTNWYESANTTSEPFIVAYVSIAMAKKMQASGNEVIMTGETAAKQRREHSDLSADDYSLLDYIEKADALIKDGQNTLLFFYISNNFYKVAIKKLQNPKYY